MDVPLDFVGYYDSINVPSLQNTIYTVLKYVVYLQTYKCIYIYIYIPTQADS